MSSIGKPCTRLVGRVLQNDWRVVRSVPLAPCQTGGHFSHGYVVAKPDGSEAFMKAMDFSDALGKPDFARAIENIAGQFNFERDLLEFCKDKRMRNVVRAIEGGMIESDQSGSPLSQVQYFLFEPADGDIRKLINAFNDLTFSWIYSVLHQTALGLNQLHATFIAHQDLKPSNVLSFRQSSEIKVGDLGCATKRGIVGPRDAFGVPGDRSYAPPEQLYGYQDPDWVARRVGSDMYQLGGLCAFLITGMSINALLSKHLDPKYHWERWKGEYVDAIPTLKQAFAEILIEVRKCCKDELLEEAFLVFRELCEPELARRGDPRRIKKGGFQYSVEPYVSRLGNARKASELSIRKALSK